MSKIIIKRAGDEPEAPAKKRFFFRRKNYVDPATGLKFCSGETYEDNHLRCFQAMQAVFSGKCKNMFEAHQIYG